MNEELQNAVVQILDKAISGIDSSVEFMQAELPEVIEQLLMWYAISNLIYAAFGGVVLYLSYLIVKKPKGKGSNWMWEWSEYQEKHQGTYISMFGIFALFPVGLGCLLVNNIMVSLQIWIAPKIWLMEYAAKLVN